MAHFGRLLSMLVGLLLGVAPAAADDGAESRLTVTTVEQYEAALARLAPFHETALVGVRADWCGYCRTIEQTILPHPDVQALLRDVGLIKIDVSAADADTADILAHLNAWGPPTFFVVETATGREYPETRSLGPFPLEDLTERLVPFAYPYGRSTIGY